MRKVFLVIMIIIAVMGIGFLLTRGPAREVATMNNQEALAPSLAVEVVEVTRGDLRETVAINVTFAPESTVPVIPKVSGTVTEVLVATGDRVRKGQTLFCIDDAHLRLQVAQAEAAYEMACANLAQARKGASAEEIKQLESAVAQARASYENAAAEYERMAELFAQEMISRQQLDSIALQKELAASSLTAAEARLAAVQKGATQEQLDALQAQVKQAKSALELARLQLSYTRVTAPIAGVLAQFSVEVGSMAAPSAPAGVIIDDRNMKAHALVPESYVNALKPGDQILLEAKSVPGTNFTGTITAVTPLADQTTRQFPVEIAVANASSLLKAGMMGTAYLTVNEARNQLVLPVETVLYDGDQAYVYVVEDGRAVRRNITTGLSFEGSVAVTAGLEEGMLVISRGQHQVKNGMLVEVR